MFGVEDDVVVGVKEAAVLSYEHLVLNEVSVVQTVQLMQQHRVQLPETRRLLQTREHFVLRNIGETAK